jgi:hypothetical protein
MQFGSKFIAIAIEQMKFERVDVLCLQTCEAKFMKAHYNGFQIHVTTPLITFSNIQDVIENGLNVNFTLW